ncbi:hypothetical protein Misp01_71160 [Microtetraspora sp. NBRC 13810]|uniref:hypothetical protein n=1 Tax=Microtetraspora sp. NBRC 13810 TaxID=3030990 RepID=UPI0024A25836|nr:hypothetical protein [Microtetraspora sp. NBRC 13810]GLW11988.1 hypothetical protein Misp01_71160 [Microtetraspora sp. NBRC 13810]
MTIGGATALAHPSYGLPEGAPADLVTLDAQTPAEAVVTRPPRNLVLKGGRVDTRSGTLI